MEGADRLGKEMGRAGQGGGLWRGAVKNIEREMNIVTDLSGSSCSESTLSASESASPLHACSTNCCSDSESLELA